MHRIRNAATTWPQAFARCRRIAKLAKRVASDGASIGSQRVRENFAATSAAEVEKAVGDLQRKLRLELSEQNLDDALGTSEELRSLVREAYGESGNPIFAAALNDSGLVYKGRGEFETAAKFLIQAVQHYESCGMKHHPSSATALHNLGVSYKEQAQVDETSALERVSLLDRASECLKEAVDRRLNTLEKAESNANQRAIATTRVVLASVYRMQAKREEAQREIEVALSVLRRAAADATFQSQTALATALNNAALFAKQDRRDEDASSLYREALKLREITLGPMHPHEPVQTISTLHNIAELHHAFSRNDEADAIRREILSRLDVDEGSLINFREQEP